MWNRFFGGMPARQGRSHALGWGVIATTRAGEESAHAVSGLVPERPLCADDGYVSDRGGLLQRYGRQSLLRCVTTVLTSIT